MLISLELNYVLNGNRSIDIDPVLFRLLIGIQDAGSLKHGAAASGLSYRHAWGLIKRWEQEFRLPVVRFKRGRGKGAKLTPFGEKMVWVYRYSEEQVGGRLSFISEELNQTLASYIQPEKSSHIQMYASHGMAVMYLYELIKEDPKFRINLQVHGSIDSLQNLYSGHCQIAGFHLPLQLTVGDLAPQYTRWLSPSRHILLKLADREQGIIVKPGNPRKIRTLEDLTRRSIRFINRQKNSGTRTIFDQLLLRGNINTKNINGYANEEFTHVAVAAMVASGFVDAGFGIRAAAEQFQLDFIPFLQETYILALDKSLPEPLINIVKTRLKSRKFRQKVNSMAGYDAKNSGTELTISQLERNGG